MLKQKTKDTVRNPVKSKPNPEQEHRNEVVRALWCIVDRLNTIEGTIQSRTANGLSDKHGVEALCELLADLRTKIDYAAHHTAYNSIVGTNCEKELKGIKNLIDCLCKHLVTLNLIIVLGFAVAYGPCVIHYVHGFIGYFSQWLVSWIA